MRKKEIKNKTLIFISYFLKNYIAIYLTTNLLSTLHWAEFLLIYLDIILLPYKSLLTCHILFILCLRTALATTRN